MTSEKSVFFKMQGHESIDLLMWLYIRIGSGDKKSHFYKSKFGQVASVTRSISNRASCGHLMPAARSGTGPGALTKLPPPFLVPASNSVAGASSEPVEPIE